MTVQVFPYEIDYYKTEDGLAPFRVWLTALKDVTGRAKIRARLDRARLGNLGDHKHVADGLCEMRIDYGPGYRVYYAIDGDRLILLFVGGDKESQKRDITKASNYLKDHRRRR